MSILIQHNMAMLNANRQFNINTKAKNKKTEKLSSGYRINRASDDAAGLSISEKMRRQIRGLQAGTENAQMGVSWVQIGEGALNEAHDILQRMNELTIKAQNGTNTLTDRAYMQAEFDQLQSELDRIGSTTTFNELNIFEEHEPVYDQLCGNRKWDDMQIHEVVDGMNQLVISYRADQFSQGEVLTLEVPPGRYTTHELIDALDDAAGLEGLVHVEFTERGTCNVNLEGGDVIDAVTGGLQYLLWDTYNGGGYGALIGTTNFRNDTDKILKMVKGQNDYFEFDVEYFDGTAGTKLKIDLFKNKPDGYEELLSKNDVMQMINNAILEEEERIYGSGGGGKTGITASAYGKSIMLSSDLGIVTGFKGNMFKIENAPPIYNSVFYDNIQEGFVWQDPAFVVGGAVLTTDSRDKEHNRFYIDGTNNKLILQPNKTATATTITIDTNTTDGYTADEMVKQLNEKFAAAGLGDEVMACKVVAKEREKFPDGKTPDGSQTAGLNDREHVGDDWVYFEGVEIRTKKEGPDAIVNIIKTGSTAYDTLFTIKNYNSYGTATDAVISNEGTNDRDAYARSAKDHIGTIGIWDGLNDAFTLTLKSTKDRYGNVNSQNSPNPDLDYEETFTIDILQGAGYRDMSAGDIRDAINNDLVRQGLDKRVVAVLDGNKIKIKDVDQKDDMSLDDDNDPYLNWNTKIELDVAGNNAGYRDIFQQEYQYKEDRTVTGYDSLTLNVPTDGSVGSGMTVTINGVDTYFDFKNGTTADDIRDAMNKTTPIKFADAHGEGDSNFRDVSMQGTGGEHVTYWSGGKAQGSSREVQGNPGEYANEPAKLAIGPHYSYLTDGMVIEKDVNDTITLSLNGREETLTLSSDGSSKTYTTVGELAAELQKQIDDTFGTTGMGGASVSVENGRFVITSTVPRGYDGANSSIEAFASTSGKSDTFFKKLNTVKTAAKAVSDRTLSNNIVLEDGVSDTFTFTYKDSTTGGLERTVTLDLTDDPKETFTSAGDLVKRIQDKLAAATYEINDPDNPGSMLQKPVRVDADMENNRLVLKTKDEGADTWIRYSASGTSTSNPDKTAQEIFGLQNKTQASMTLNKPVQDHATLDTTKTFKFFMDIPGVGPDTYILHIGSWDDRRGLEKQLNDELQKILPIKDVKATIDGNGYLTLTRQTPGDCTMSMTYATGGDVMADMFGYEPKPNVTVTSSGNTITITAPGSKIEVDSRTGGGLVEKTVVTAFRDFQGGNGFHSAKHSTVTSTKLDANGIVLNRWNSDLQFKFKHGKDTTPVEISVELTHSTGNPPVPTSLDAIRTELQAKIDAALQAQGVAADDGIDVVLDKNTNQLSLKAKKPGSQYQFSGMSSVATNSNPNLEQTNKIGGGFFHHVMCGYTPVTDKVADPADVNGEQFAEDIFAQGRHDVVTEWTYVGPFSDTLTIDLNFISDKNHDGILDDAEKKSQEVISIEVKLDHSGNTKDFFSGDRLKNMIAERLNWTLENYEKYGVDPALDSHTELKELKEQVEKLSNALGTDIQLHPGLIEVDIGRHDTGIYGNKDNVAISFTITKDHDIATPVEGYFYIDGVRGNAAYETFYHTIGQMIPAYIVGTKDISDGVVLGEDDNELVFLLEGELKVLDLKGLPKGEKIPAQTIIDTLTAEFARQTLPLVAELTDDGFLKISHKRMGKHTIEQVTGSARNALFFEEHAEQRPNQERYIRVSSNEGDRVEVYSPRFSTMMMHINSICVSTVENAEKATNRLKEAITMVSDMRNVFGSQQNRLEHTINNNRNKEENTQAAESRIRDADISKEMVEFSNLSIIQQAGQAIMAQARQNAQLALQMLS